MLANCGIATPLHPSEVPSSPFYHLFIQITREDFESNFMRFYYYTTGSAEGVDDRLWAMATIVT